ncbi:beta strand repeat-containing protein [Actinoplanes solisilvae]|uniref:beta strand repeat-containing protein n=1 Tax=Actinoplanes solisilvae TaxID=2486853 RepID=UPI000FD75D8A|nr:IPT/TIG domain-containing protein [Actinoplanes solisilvae]
MRKSSTSRSRLALAAGLTISAAGAAMIVAPGVALAATTVTPPVVAPGGSVTVVDDSATIADGTDGGGTPNRVQILTTGTTCVTPIPATSTSVIAATVTLSSSTAKSVTFTVPSSLATGTNGQVKRYIACLYEPTGSNARVGSATGYAIPVGAVPTANPAIGPTGGGNVVAVSTGTGGNVFTGISNIQALFTTENMCPATYGTPTASMVATAQKQSDSSVNVTVPTGVVTPAAASVQFSLCLYNGATTSSALLTAVAYTATQIQLSNTTGSWAGGNGLNVTAPNAILAGIDSPGALFTTATSCPGTYSTTVTLGSSVPVTGNSAPRRVSDNRLALTVPQLYTNVGAWNSAVGSNTSLPWQLCIYNGEDNGVSTTIAASPYTATVLHTATAVTPRAGTALGGSRVTVSGTSFPLTAAEITATLGGSPLTNITPLTRTAFSATTPSHIPANNVALVVTTSAGSVTLQNAYNFTSALSVRPNTAPNTRVIDVVVNGLGFQSATWNSGDLTNAHIYLVNGLYSSSLAGGNRANPPIAECSNVLVLSDSELICRLDLRARLNAAGTAVMSVTPVGGTLDTVAGSRVVTNFAGGTFSALDIGKTVTDPAASPSIPSSTTITGIISATSALLSNAASGTGVTTPIVLSAGGPVKTVTATTATGALSGIDPVLVAADDTRIVFGARINATTGSVLSAQAGATANIAPDALTNGTTTLSVFPATANLPVPEGAYNLTYVSNGTVNAVSTDATYIQSGISSSSTFTVAPF